MSEARERTIGTWTEGQGLAKGEPIAHRVIAGGSQRAGDDDKRQAFGPIVLELMQGAADVAGSSEYKG